VFTVPPENVARRKEYSYYNFPPNKSSDSMEIPLCLAILKHSAVNVASAWEPLIAPNLFAAISGLLASATKTKSFIFIHG